MHQGIRLHRNITRLDIPTTFIQGIKCDAFGHSLLTGELLHALEVEEELATKQ